MKIRYKKICKTAHEPTYSSPQSAGADLRGCINENIIINPGEIKTIPTGIACEIPKDHVGMVCSRSGLAAKNGIAILNSPGIIDSDYRGEIKLIIQNHFNEKFVIENGMRLAQLVIVPYKHVTWTLTDNLSDTERSTGGLGSTGLK